MFKLISTLTLFYVSMIGIISVTLGSSGLWGGIIANQPAIFIVTYIIIVTHVTITCMSLSFHRYHTHKGVVINKYLDGVMQLWLWVITSMSKADWVSIHTYHHAYSDTDKDPHSPVTKGLAHVFFLGVLDYTQAKELDAVKKIKKTIPMNKLEAFIHGNTFLGPGILTLFLLISFGPLWGTILSIINFLISPVFAVGGVNALAHSFGYKNHAFKDNSRNIGFIFPLNFMICGELDHNNHHAQPKSCSFRHRWFEFDIGFLYLNILAKMDLAQLKNVYNVKSLKKDFAAKVIFKIDKDKNIYKKFELLAWEKNIPIQELKEKIEKYLCGEKIKICDGIKEFISEVTSSFDAPVLAI